MPRAARSTGFSAVDTTELVVEIQSGEGGDDSKAFVHELLATYCKYAQRRQFSSESLNTSEGHVIARFTGEGVWAAFRNESGKHCVQRCPPTEKSGRRHTSIVSVAVLSLPPQVAMRPLPAGELVIKTQGGSGPGGQHQNKTDSAVRMTHSPTGLQVLINGRDQQRNRREALRILSAKVHAQREREHSVAYDARRKSQLSDSGRGAKVRTYNFIESRVVDHRSGRKTGQIKRVMEGELDLLLD